MKCTTLLSPVILLSVILAGCVSDSNSPSGTVLAEGTAEEQNTGSGDNGNTGDNVSGDGSSSSGDNGSGDGSTGSGTDDTGNGDGGTDSGTSGSGDTGEDGNTEVVAAETTTTTQTFSHPFGAHTITINITATEYHQNNPDLTSYRMWSYRNPATLGLGSSAEKVYFYDSFSDPDEEAYGQENIEGFTKDSGIKKVTYSHSDLSPVSTNKFFKKTTESIHSGESELSGVTHDKINSQTFSNDTPPVLLAEEMMTIIEYVGYADPCAEKRASLGELTRYNSNGYWQPGDRLTVVWDIHSPAYQCVDGVPVFLEYANLTTTTISELVGPVSQITLQGKSFNSVLKFATSEVMVSDDTGNTVTDNMGSSYYQLHTGFVADESTDCLIGGSGTEYCTDRQSVANNLPTIPVIN